LPLLKFQPSYYKTLVEKLLTEFCNFTELESHSSQFLNASPRDIIIER